MDQITRRTLGLSAAAGWLGLAAGAARAAGEAVGSPAITAAQLAPYVNPEYRPVVGGLLGYTRGALTADTLRTARAGMLKNAAPPLAQPAWSARTVPGLAGAPPVAVIVVNAGRTGAPRPAILHLHGGGYVLGSARTDLHRLQEIALALDVVIVSVDYRLAPETPFPGPLDDAYAGLSWLHASASDLGVDPARIAVMGESAGGGLAAMLAIRARDRGEIPLAYQMLIYPMLDDRTGSTVKKPFYQGALIWTPANNRFGWSALLGMAAGSPHPPYGAVPARVETLRGLPPAFIGVGSIDLFVDEDIDYARRLVDAGVLVTLQVAPGGFHGFDQFPGSPTAARFHAAVLDALRVGLGVPRSASPP